MPILVPSDELQPGMRLIDSFVWRDRTMLTADTVLTVEDVNTLRARFSENNFRVADPLLDAVVEFEDDTYEREVARAAQRRIAKCMSEVNTRFGARASFDGVNVSGLQSAVVDVIKYLHEHPVSAALVDDLVGAQGYLSEHAGNVFYLSMLLGFGSSAYVAKERARQSTARDLDPQMLANLIPLGLGAMLMDLGMLPLQDLFTEDGPLTPGIWEEIRDHPRVGAKMLPDEISATAKTIVRTHHENMDGSGYPEGISGGKLHVFARIIRIADAYDAATSPRVYKEAKSPVRVVWEMSVGSYRRYYDRTLMGTFARMMQPFPIGSKIRLSDGRYAVVVKYNRENPVAPLMIIAFDDQNRRLKNTELPKPQHLGERPDLCAASFCGEDLSFMYDGEPDQIYRSRVGVWPTLFEAAYP